MVKKREADKRLISNSAKKDFGDLLGDSWKEYKSNFKTIFNAYFWLYIIPYAILSIFLLTALFNHYNNIPIDVLRQVADVGNKAGVTSGVVDTLSGLENYKFVYPKKLYALNGLIFVFSFFLALTLFYLAFHGKNRRIGFGEAFKGGLKYFWTFLGLSILVIIALIPLYLLLIIPGIIFTVYWIFSHYFLVGENEKIVLSMRNSFYLIKGRWWKTFGYLILWIILIVAISVAIAVPSVVLFFIFILKTISTGEVSLELFAFMGVIDFITDVISALIIAPLSIFFFKNMFLEWKKTPVVIKRKSKK